MSKFPAKRQSFYNPWTVEREGDSDCKHENFDHYILTSNPPIDTYRCKGCGREIRHYVEYQRPKWPENREPAPPTRPNPSKYST